MVRTSAVLALVLLVASCKPKVGGACSKDGKEACQDKATAMVCHDGKWVSMPCRGATGCVAAGDSAQCDNMTSQADDVCNLEGDYACSMDKKEALVCQKRKWLVSSSCRGAKGCQVDTKHVKCDTGIARVDEACMKENENGYACSDDHKTSLVCRSGKFVLSGKCGGPKGCRVKDDGAIECDDSVGEVGDPCDLVEHYACARDGKMLIKCQGSKFVKDEECRKGKSCKIQGDRAGCQ